MSLRSILFILLSAFFAGSLEIHANIVIMNGLTHEVQVSPGGKSRRSILLQNTSDKESSVRIYQTDYSFSYTGESKYEKPGTNKRSNASWITINNLFLTLKPQETRSLDFEVTVPPSDTLTGTYWSVIMLEGVAEPDTASRVNALTLSTVIRYAIQIITNLDETGSRDLQFLQTNLTKGNDSHQLEVDLENNGQRVLRPEVRIELFDGEGKSIGVFRADPKRIYPGTSVRINVKMPGLNPGKYSGVLVADCGGDYIFGSNVTLQI